MKSLLVLDAHLTHALVIIQSLGRAGYRVLVGSDQDRALGGRSRYAARSVRFDDISLDVAGYARQVHDVVTGEGVDLIIPVSDRSARALVEAGTPETRARLAVAPEAAYRTALDKLTCHRLAEEVGLPTPRYAFLAAGAPLPGRLPFEGYPVVLKPRSSVTYRDNRLYFHRVSYARSAAELGGEVDAYGGAVDLLLQEHVGGRGAGVELVRSASGDICGRFQHSRVREMPLSGGGSTCRVGVPVGGDLLRMTEAMLARLGWVGVAMAEFKIDGGVPYFMEINGRFWGSVPLPIASGVPFPVRHAEVFLNGPGFSSPPPAYKSGRRAIKLPGDLYWITEVLRGRGVRHGIPRAAAVGALGDYMMPWRTSFDGVTWRDPAVSWYILTEFFRDRLARG
jgi:predicted ATP-grasp superfamily ATP-dependent carboligase